MAFYKGDEYLTALLDGIHGAKKSVYVEMYLMRYSPAEHHPVREIALALKAAVERGARVEVVLDASMGKDNASALEALELFSVPARLGPRSPVNHSKLVVVDGEWMLCGSQNWTISALASNLESAVAVRDRVVARALIRKLKRIAPERLYNVYDDLLAYGVRQIPDGEAIVGARRGAPLPSSRAEDAARRLGIGYIPDAAGAEKELKRREHPVEVIEEAGLEAAAGKYLWPVRRGRQVVDALAFDTAGAEFLRPESARLPGDERSILLLVKDPWEALRLQTRGFVNAVPYGDADRVIRAASELADKHIYLADSGEDAAAFKQAGIDATMLESVAPDRPLDPKILRETLPQILYLLQVKQFQNAIEQCAAFDSADAAWARGYAELKSNRPAEALRWFLDCADSADRDDLRDAALAGWQHAARALRSINP